MLPPDIEMEGVQHVPEAIHMGTPAPLTTEAEPAWIEHAIKAVTAVEASLEPRLRKMGEGIYEDLLYTVQDYLLENVIYNVKQQIASADRQANQDRRRASALEVENADLLDALKCARLILEPAVSPNVCAVVDAAIARATGQQP